jgi:hypothetical protein
MGRSTGRNPVESVSTDEVSSPGLIDGRMPAIERPTLSDTGPHAGAACAPRPCRSSTMSPSNFVSNSNITCS